MVENQNGTKGYLEKGKKLLFLPNGGWRGLVFLPCRLCGIFCKTNSKSLVVKESVCEPFFLKKIVLTY